MALIEGMFLFEVVVESVKSLIESKQFVIKSDFADIFSLELRDPKHLNIVMPEPPPLPPEPPGKKAKKPKPKPKPKGKKGAVVEEPSGPLIQSGQSVLFACSAEFLIQNMRKSPIEMSLWDKDEKLIYIGSNIIPWDEVYLEYLSKIANCQDPPPVVVKDEYNIFDEGTAKLVAKLGIQIKLSFLKDKVSAAFRTLSEDSNNRKYLYTGLNSKTTSYICTLKTDDDTFIKNSNKIQNNFIEDKPKAIQYANFTNAPGANLTFFEDGAYCCMKNANKPPESIYKSPETYPSIDEITDYVRKIIVSCNDNMRMLTPHPNIKPRVKASDIEKLCHCTQTGWPESKLSQRVKQDVLNDSCLVCDESSKKQKGSRSATIDLANIRGPCGNPNCKISRNLRSYIEKLVEEDDKEVIINEIVGPCGSKPCSVADKIQEFLRHEGVFNQLSTLEGLSTQCACIQTMKNALLHKKNTCQSVCSKDCINSSDADGNCKGSECPVISQVYDIYYCAVDNRTTKSSSPSSKQSSQPVSQKSSNVKFCATDCPSTKSSHISCSKSVCSTTPIDAMEDTKCQDIKIGISPADSEILINFDDIRNPCCVKTCEVVEKVKDFIVDSWESKQNKKASCVNDPCYCDCECHFNSSKTTTYCAVCGGYEVQGTDLKDQPLYAKPHPCPIYHKIYNRKNIKVESPWIENDVPIIEDQKSVKSIAMSQKALKTAQKVEVEGKNITSFGDVSSQKTLPEINEPKEVKGQVRKISVPDKEALEKAEGLILEKPPTQKYIVPFVPKNMGWLWNAEDVPGLQYRPQWKPGASLKGLVRRYRALRGSIDIMAKKKRAMLQKRKKLEMKPTLTIRKIDGEYEVQMEVFKKYSKERLLYQYPYEENPPLKYTIGKTDEELEKVLIKRERKERRETRRKYKILQSTFRDRCQEICLKAYNQAIGVLPIPDPNNPPCPCDIDNKNLGSPQIDSCSCSDRGDISSSDTDGDDWIIEFSPPAARWDAKAKHLPVVTNSDTQYTYLDYRVKLLDKFGNPVPRFFKGPDGKQECSDLGGFWGPDHVWLDINKDGYIGVDNRWVPMNFIGPDGMFYSAKDGSFTDNNGHFLKIGVDGYIDKDGKWAWYAKRRDSRMRVGGNNLSKTLKKVPTKQSLRKKENLIRPPREAKPLNMKSVTIKPTVKDTKASKPISYSHKPKSKSTIVMSMTPVLSRYNSSYRLNDKIPSTSPKKQNLRQYRKQLFDYDTYNFFSEEGVTKANRACNTKNYTPFTIVNT